MQRTIRYRWVIVRNDTALDQTSSRTARIGPSGASPALLVPRIMENGERFRLRDGNGAVRFTGSILGEYRGDEPLEDYGRANGCVRIEYEREGRWVSLQERTPPESSLGFTPASPLVPDLQIPD